jgi:hypothetical protein
MRVSTQLKTAGPAIQNAAQERARIATYAHNFRQAVNYYRYWRDYPEQQEALQQAQDKLLTACKEFQEITYNNPFAGSFGADIAHSFYYSQQLLKTMAVK